MDRTEAAGAPVISDQVKVDGVVETLTLTSTGKLEWKDRCLVVEKEVLGFVAEGPKVRIHAIVEAGSGICCGGGKDSLVRKSFVFEPLSEDSLKVLCQKLQEYIDSLGRPKRLLVFVNPYGGKRSASKIFVSDVKPMLEDANIQYTLHETNYQLHAKDVVKSLDLSKYDGIVCVSGDGVLVEVVNGLLEREDWSTAIRMPLGAVPAGTGNGMAKSLHDAIGEPCSPANAVLTIIRGHKCALDVATISQGKTKFFSVLMLAWGLIADIDIESEKYRWMGSARIDFYALKRIFKLRKYDGCIRFVPAPGYEAYGEATSLENDVASIVNASGEKTDMCTQYGYAGSTHNMNNLNWRRVDGPFISIWLHNVPWGSETTMAAPDAKFSDGYLDLIMIRECSTLGLVSLMTAMSSGSHVKSPFVTYIKVKAFVLEPGPRSNNTSMEGIIDVDGEVLARGKGTYQCDQKALMAYDKLYINVDQGLATLFSPV